jgi:hypothetical protein
LASDDIVFNQSLTEMRNLLKGIGFSLDFCFVVMVFSCRYERIRGRRQFSLFCGMFVHIFLFLQN